MAFTADQKARIKHFLSYPDWVALAQSIVLGFPAASEPLFLVEDAFRRLTPGGGQSTLINLAECECIEVQLRDARTRFRARRVGNVELNPDEPDMLRRELAYWTIRLADDLGVIPDPYSQALHAGLMNAGSVNSVVVSH